jgi:N-acetylmuramoyl-L-alanine amidase
MACFISAGHHLKDSGALGSGTQENMETIVFRDLVVTILRVKGLKVITDDDNETLAQYLTRIQPGEGSVVLEFHFDAFNKTASGTTALVGNDADRLDKLFGKELVDTTAFTLGIPNRGVKTELESKRGSLGLMRKKGIVCLLELCFIDNVNDMGKYNTYKLSLANKIANIIEKYENLIA